MKNSKNKDDKQIIRELKEVHDKVAHQHQSTNDQKAGESSQDLADQIKGSDADADRPPKEKTASRQSMDTQLKGSDADHT